MKAGLVVWRLTLTSWVWRLVGGCRGSDLVEVVEEDHWIPGVTAGWAGGLEPDLLEAHNQALEDILQDVEDGPSEQVDIRDIEIGFDHHHC